VGLHRDNVSHFFPSYQRSHPTVVGRMRVGKLTGEFYRAKSRLEGKNRRDGATVSMRVLKLVDRLGRELYSKTAEGPESVEEDIEARSTRRRKKRKDLIITARL
jgi:hypothetical protein